MQSRLGVTAQQRFVVRVIGRYPGIAPGQLAAVLHLDPGSVSATIRRLEESRIVQRRPASNDGRSVSLVLTARSRRMDVPDPHTIEGALERLLERVPRDRLATIRTFFASFVRQLEGPTASAEPPRARAAGDGPPRSAGRGQRVSNSRRRATG